MVSDVNGDNDFSQWKKKKERKKETQQNNFDMWFVQMLCFSFPLWTLTHSAVLGRRASATVWKSISPLQPHRKKHK